MNEQELERFEAAWDSVDGLRGISIETTDWDDPFYNRWYEPARKDMVADRADASWDDESLFGMEDTVLLASLHEVTSDLRTIINYETVLETMKAVDPDGENWSEEEFRHWIRPSMTRLTSWLKQIFVRRGDNPAWLAAINLHAAGEHLYVLDEERYYDRCAEIEWEFLRDSALEIASEILQADYHVSDLEIEPLLQPAVNEIVYWLRDRISDSSTDGTNDYIRIGGTSLQLIEALPDMPAFVRLGEREYGRPLVHRDFIGWLIHVDEIERSWVVTFEDIHDPVYLLGKGIAAELALLGSYHPLNDPGPLWEVYMALNDALIEAPAHTKRAWLVRRSFIEDVAAAVQRPVADVEQAIDRMADVLEVW